MVQGEKQSGLGQSKVEVVMEDLRGLTEDGGVGVAVNEVEVKLENISNTENSSDMDRLHLSDI